MAVDAKNISPYIAESIMNIYGVIAKVDLARYEGLTAKEIAKAVLLEHKLSEAEIKSRLDRYMEDLPYSYYNVAWSDRVNVTEGAKELLQEMERREVLAGIATGEEEKVAKMRLEKAGLAPYFKFGAYGNDGFTFDEILAKALAEAGKQGFQKDDGVLVVSNPIAVGAGKQAGIRTVAVETVMHSGKALRAAGADLVVRDLRDRARIFEFLLG